MRHVRRHGKEFRRGFTRQIHGQFRCAPAQKTEDFFFGLGGHGGAFRLAQRWLVGDCEVVSVGVTSRGRSDVVWCVFRANGSVRCSTERVKLTHVS